jgi:hypothetical protein
MRFFGSLAKGVYPGASGREGCTLASTSSYRTLWLSADVFQQLLDGYSSASRSAPSTVRRVHPFDVRYMPMVLYNLNARTEMLISAAQGAVQRTGYMNTTPASALSAAGTSRGLYSCIAYGSSSFVSSPSGCRRYPHHRHSTLSLHSHDITARLFFFPNDSRGSVLLKVPMPEPSCLRSGFVGALAVFRPPAAQAEHTEFEWHSPMDALPRD